MKDNYFQTAINCFANAEAALGPMGQKQNPVMFHLIEGMRRIAQGLRQDSDLVERRLAVIEAALQPPKSPTARR